MLLVGFLDEKAKNISFCEQQLKEPSERLPKYAE
jgi:hypothetical protein